ncbi:hypothetical protein C8J56DRAFT_1082166 [Mycena floridula]|nr:hypothetical protein C8J56DRAFT_1082166 [Mycena floridula]
MASKKSSKSFLLHHLIRFKNSATNAAVLFSSTAKCDVVVWILPAVEVPLIPNKDTDVIMYVDAVPSLPRPPMPPRPPNLTANPAPALHRPHHAVLLPPRRSLSLMVEEIGSDGIQENTCLLIMGPPRSCKALENLTSKPGMSSHFSTKTMCSIKEEGGFLLILLI